MSDDFKKKNILYLSSYAFMKGGGQESLYQLVKYIDKKKFNIHVIFPDRGNLLERIKGLEVKTDIVPMGPIRFLNLGQNLKAIVKIFLYIKRHQIALVHTDTPRTTFYAGICTLFLRVPLFWHIRTCDSDGIWDHLLTFFSTKLILVANYLKKRFYWLKDEDKFYLIPNGVDINQFKIMSADKMPLNEELGVSKDCFLIGQVGRLEELKGPQYLIQAIHLIDKQLGDYRVLFAGGGDEHYMLKLRKMVETLSLADKIIFLGKRGDIHHLMANIDLLVHPSLTEAFPRVVLEAMASEKPVIASNVGGVPEAVLEGRTGYLLPPKNEKILASKILYLKNNKETRLKLGQSGRARAEELFSIERHVRMVENLYLAN